MSKTVFITRPVELDSILYKELTSRGYEVRAESLITQEQVSIPLPLPKTSWIFFSSKNAVTHFFAQVKDAGPRKVAAIGRGTAEELRKFTEVDFTGDSSDTEVTGKAFRKKIRTSKVLFPQAEDGLRAIQKNLKPEQCIDLVCYRTIVQTAPVGKPDVLVFSSPSNVQSFFRSNSLTDFQYVIAFGKSTAKALEEGGRKEVHVLHGVTDQHILRAIIQAPVS